MNKIIFSGLMILVCCLFGGVGMVGAETDISVQCINLSIPAGPEVTTLDDICRAAGYGPCLRTDPAAAIALYREEDCIDQYAGAGIDCNLPMSPSEVGKSAMALGGVICDVRGWGILTPPKNVPEDFGGAVANATNWLLGFVSMLAVLMIIWGGINYLTAAGDEEKARTAKKIITYGLTGVVIAGLAYAMVTVIVTVILK